MTNMPSILLINQGHHCHSLSTHTYTLTGLTVPVRRSQRVDFIQRGSYLLCITQTLIENCNQKFKFCLYLLILMPFQTFMTFFCGKLFWLPLTSVVWTKNTGTFFKISSFMFHRSHHTGLEGHMCEEMITVFIADLYFPV